MSAAPSATMPVARSVTATPVSNDTPGTSWSVLVPP
jgi:hypothetical protein